jgi:ATP-binding cassette subfamily B protein
MLADDTIYYRSFADGPIPKTPWAFMTLFVRRRLRGQALAVVVCAAMSMVTMGFEPPALRGLVNELQRMAGSGTWTYDSAFWFAVMAGSWITSSIFNRLHQLSDLRFTPTLRAMIQSYLFSYTLEHSPRYFQENFAGKLGQKIKQAGQSTVQILGIVLHDCVRIVVILTMGVVLLFSTNIWFAVVLAGWTIAYLGLSALLARRCVELSRAYSDEASTATGRLIDAVSNVELIRAFARAPFERDLFSIFIGRERDASRRVRRFLAVTHFFQHGATIAFQVGLTAIAVVEVINGAMTTGDFVMVVSLSTIIAGNVWTLSQRLLEFFEQYGIVEESIELVAQPHEIVDRPMAAPLRAKRGAIEYRDVHFAHADGTPVFAGLNLRIESGEKTALVGPTGAGKSMLVRLLRRQFPLTSGQICIDEQDISTVTLESLNRAVAEVPQLPGLFHRTLRDNIRYARPDATDAEVEEAARRAYCHEFIARRVEGYETIVGEQGIRLSGGERQRVAIARAFLKDAPILVLDEATSSLDSETEHLIQEALFRLIAGRTVIAIAHRLSTITGMDRIIFLDRGQVVEQGSHEELLRLKGRYAALWRRQVGGFLPEEPAQAAD